VSKLELDSTRKPIVEAIVKKYPAYFQDVDADRILFLVSQAKTARKPVGLSPVKLPYSLAMRQKYIMIFNTKKLEGLDSAKLNLYILRELMRIDAFEDGTLQPYPVQDFPEILAKFGIDWEDRSDIADVLTIDEEESTEKQGAPVEQEVSEE
jgi:hypothetical protein